jgi:hypothetical protein
MKGKWTIKKILLFVFVGWIGVLILFGVFGAMMERLSPDYRAAQKMQRVKSDSLAKVEARELAIRDSIANIEKFEKEALITAYVMSKSFIEENLKDPESYEERKSEYYYIKNGNIEVMIDYTATNSFGGRIRTKRIFHFTKDLKFLEQFESE